MKAKVVKIVVVHEPCEIEITGATLLTVKEASDLLTVEDRACGSWWWCRSPGVYKDLAVDVDDDGNVHDFGGFVNGDCAGVRPALQIANLECSNLEIGDKFCFGNEYFKVISANLALCDSIVGHTRFDEKSNDYKNSEIKTYVDAWFNELMGHEMCMVEEDII